MIPKRIFYVWGFGEQKTRDVQICIQSWRNVMPDYEIIEINEQSKRYFDWQAELKRSKFFRVMYKNRLWAFMADYIRLRVLYENGGIYCDTDIQTIKSLNKFLENPAFVGLQNLAYTEPAILGAHAKNEFLRKVLDFYENDFWNLPIYTIPQIFQHILATEYGIKQYDITNVLNTPDLCIYSKDTFIPFIPDGNIHTLSNNTYTIHWFKGSWVRKSVLEWLEHKHINPNKELDISKDLIRVERFCLPFTKISLIKKEQRLLSTTTKIFHCVILTRTTARYVYLFGILPILKTKKN